MSKIFKHIGLITLVCFSFYITEKTQLVLKNNDDIMLKINEEYKKFNQEGKNAQIKGNKIIPGTCFKKVNKEKTYQEMLKLGKYNSDFYVYDYEYPEISIINNRNKYIIRDNNYEKNIYIFINLNYKNYEEILSNKYKNYNFYTTSEFFLNNQNIIEKIIKNKNSILITKTEFSLLKKANKKYNEILDKNISCYFKDEDNKYINDCSLIKNNSIYVEKNYKVNNLLNLKKNLVPGLFISFEYSSYSKEKQIIEKYIKTKGYQLSIIDESISEC